LNVGPVDGAVDLLRGAFARSVDRTKQRVGPVDGT